MLKNNEEIKRRAFNLYQQRMRLGYKGDEKSDWFEAEEMYRQETRMAERMRWK